MPARSRLALVPGDFESFYNGYLLGKRKDSPLTLRELLAEHPALSLQPVPSALLDLMLADLTIVPVKDPEPGVPLYLPPSLTWQDIADATPSIVAANGQGDEPTSAAADSTETAPTRFRAGDPFGRDLTQDAREGKLDPVIGREREIERVIQVLARLTRNNPVLVGAPGTGKTAVAGGLAQQIVSGQVPQRMRDRLVYRVNVESLAENSGSQDDVTMYLTEVIDQVRSRGDVVLFLDGLRALPPDAWPTLRPMFSRGELQIIGAITQDEYDDLLNEHGALERAFVPIQVAEPTVGQTIEILKGLRDRYEAHHRVSITDGALAAAAEAASRTLPGERLPGKAVDLVDEAASLRRMRLEAALPASEWEVVAEVDEDLIAEALSIMLGLSSDGAADVLAAIAPQGPPFAPAGMTEEDREIWGMA